MEYLFNGYECTCLNAKRFNVHGRPSGGIALYYKQDFHNAVTRLCEDFNLAVIVRLASDVLKLPANVILVCAYIPPEGSVSYETNECNGIEMLKEKMLEISSLYPDDVWCLLGDFNARTGQRQDFIIDGFQNVPGMEWYIGEEFNVERFSKDKVVNKFGISLLEMCIELNLHIANGRVEGDNNGEFTFINRNGHSVIDYVMTSTEMFNWITSVEVLSLDVGCHFPLLCKLRCTEMYGSTICEPDLPQVDGNTNSFNKCATISEVHLMLIVMTISNSIPIRPELLITDRRRDRP